MKQIKQMSFPRKRPACRQAGNPDRLDSPVTLAEAGAGNDKMFSCGDRLCLSIVLCLWFSFFGSSMVMADAPAKAGYTASGLRSPFKRQFLEQVPLVNLQEKAKPKAKDKGKKITAPPQIAVEGIIAGREASYAIIGGKVFRAEDKIGEALITGISKEGVEVLFDAEKLFYPAPSKALAVNREKKDAE